MIANLNAGAKVKFQYIDRVRKYDNFPAHTNYAVESYEGTLLEVRDTAENVVSTTTVFCNTDTTFPFLSLKSMISPIFALIILNPSN